MSAKCSRTHNLYSCKNFLNEAVNERQNFVKQKQLCQKCLRADHTSDCKSLRSCLKCRQQHQTSLHIESTDSTTNPPVPATSSSSSQCVSHPHREPAVIPETLLVNLKDSYGKHEQCKVFVGDGSEFNFISEHCLT